MKPLQNGDKNNSEIVLTASELAVQNLHENVSSFWCNASSNTIPILNHPPTSFEFLRDYVAPNRPCILQNAVTDTNGNICLLSLDKLVDMYPNLLLHVQVTPDGHGDCVRLVKCNHDDEQQEDVFVTPLEQAMTMRDFQKRLCNNHLENAKFGDSCYQKRAFESYYENPTTSSTGTTTASSTENGIVYYSRQDDCLRRELNSLVDCFPATIGFCEEAFGTGPPDAMNLWMGNEHSVSSWHKDPYENIFHVLHGTKVFTICPPVNALVHMKQDEYPSGAFVCDADGQWKVQRHHDQRVRWIGSDVTQFPDLLTDSHVITIQVHAGETLYLPSLWFHKVTQTCETIAINYWYDMKFEAKWCYFQFLEELTLVKGNVEKKRSDDGAKGE